MEGMQDHVAKRSIFWELIENAWLPFAFVTLLWIIHTWSVLSGINLVHWGVLPRAKEGIPGILTSVFIHSDFSHLSSNTAPILILGTLLYYFYRKVAIPVFLWIWFISGLWLWIGGGSLADRPTWHIGASTLIYGLAVFLFFSGIFRKHKSLMVVSALVVFLYGSMMWGILPIMPGMSWEGHLFGALAGLLVAINYRKEGPQKPEFVWEEEEDEESDEWMEKHEEPPTQNLIITYHLKPSDSDKKDIK